MSVQEVLARMKDRDCDGYTISGGEPVEQWEELLEVLDGLGGETGHSIVLFTGYSREELCSVARWEALAARCDVLVSGRFEATSLLPQGQRSGLIASSNQETFYLRGRVTPEDMVGVPEAEVHIGSDGRIRISGLPSGKLVNWVRG
jgi:organic radical activating enzyme